MAAPISTIIPALIFGLLAVALIAYLVVTIMQALSFDPRTFWQRRKLASRLKLLNQADDFLQRELVDEALALLREAFFLETTALSAEFIDQITAHNISTLGRFVVLAEKRGGRLPNLPVLEGLFYSRKELLDSHLETLEARRAIKTRRKGEGKDTPPWADLEYSSRIEALADRLVANQQSIRNLLGELFDAIKTMRASQQVTYH